MSEISELLDLREKLQKERKAMRRAARLKRRKARRLMETPSKPGRAIPDALKAAQLESAACKLDGPAFSLSLRIGQIERLLGILARK